MEIFDEFSTVEENISQTDEFYSLRKNMVETTLKTRDIYDETSDWVSLEVTMPKNKPIFSFVLKILDDYPNMFPLLRQILGI